MKARHLYSRVSIEADIDSLEDSRQATAALLRALRDRLTPEADQAVAQLPQELKRLWTMRRRPSTACARGSCWRSRSSPWPTDRRWPT